jgi:hypothetical protein
LEICNGGDQVLTAPATVSDAKGSGSSAGVLGPCHWFEVCGIHAGSHPAEVVEVEACGDRSDVAFIAPPVGGLLLLVATGMEPAVAIFVL